jgi:uncharacterized lipoprotein YehR (DUF1307 family)
MKKVIVMLFVLFIALTLTSCGASWEQTKKNWKSDYDGGIDREITVVNMRTGELVWSYTGKCYIDSTSTAGDITVIYYDEMGMSKKADFIGSYYGLTAIEL